MSIHNFARILLLASLAAQPAHADTVTPAPKFYAYCMELGVPGLEPRPFAAQAGILRELGFDGAACPLRFDGSLEANLKVLDDAGLQAYMVWTEVNVNPAKGAAYDSRLPDAIRKLKGRPATVCVMLGGLKPADPQGMEPAVKALRELGDAAAEAGVRVSIYHHAEFWAESVPFSIEVVAKTNHPQVGFNFNLCHWLKVEGGRDYRPILREHAAKLFAVIINGATVGTKTWTNGLIRPLDEGDFDLGGLIATLDEIGYRGPVGLMCFGVPGDLGGHLARSMKVWRHLHDPSLSSSRNPSG